MGLAAYIFLSAAQRRLLRDGCGIFTFHKIAAPPPQTIDPFEYTTTLELETKLATLRTAGFQPAQLNAAKLETRGAFVVTFDDGYACVADQALPVLERQKITAMEFLIAGKLGGRNEWDVAKGDVAQPLMDAAQVRTWLAAGHQIGSHSLTHPNLRKIPLAQAREEIVASKKSLEDTFGVAVEHFCYPYGSYNEAIRDLVAEAGYQSASTVNHGISLPGESPYELKRLMPLTTTELLRKALHRLRRKVAPAAGV
jgi:peptidoglycan/xylan/chitin deacetylase (PgdA/CDA1 family)